MRHVDLRLLFPIRPPAVPGARWLVGVGLLLALLGFFWSCGVFSPGTRYDPQSSYGAALFFSAIIAYIVPIYGYISERTASAIDALRPVLEVSDGQIDTWRERVHRKPLRWLVIVLGIGITSGVAHNLVLLYDPYAGSQADGLSSSPQLAIVAGTQMTWIVVTTVVAGLLDNALMLGRAARRCRMNLLDTSRLRPFATVAVISTLAIIGAQAVFPIMNIEGDLDPLAYLPGLLATGVPMVMLAALPVWPVHRRIAAAKRQALTEVDAEIAAQPAPDPAAPDTVAALAPLLVYRRELLAVSEWPFDIGVVTRLLLYLIIPPLTWVGAALIEHAVENLL